MSDKAKAKKIDLRVSAEVFEEVTLVAWVSGQKRSELLRTMIEFYIEHAKVHCDGQNLMWAEILEQARQEQVAAEVTFEEVCKEMSGRTVRQTEIEVSDELGDELQYFAELYAKNAIEAFKKHSGGRNDG